MAKQVVCDRCGRVIRGKVHSAVVKGAAFDLCVTCEVDLEEFMKPLPQEMPCPTTTNPTPK